MGRTMSTVRLCGNIPTGEVAAEKTKGNRGEVAPAGQVLINKTAEPRGTSHWKQIACFTNEASKVGGIQQEEKEVDSKESADNKENKKEANIIYLFLNERDLYFSRCYIVGNFDKEIKYILTLKEETKEVMERKYKKQGPQNYLTITDFRDVSGVIDFAFNVDPSDSAQLIAATNGQKVDKIFHTQPIKKSHEMNTLFQVSAPLLKDDGELHVLIGTKQYESMQIKEIDPATGFSLKRTVELDAKYCKRVSLKHLKAAEDSQIHVFQLDPTTKAGGCSSLISVVHGEDPIFAADAVSVVHGGVVRTGASEGLFNDVMVAEIENIRKDSSPLIAHVSKEDLLDAEKLKDQLVLDGNDIGKDQRG